MKTPCSVIRDLLPLYQDGVCSPESRQLVEEHLEECETCRAEWERMSAPIPTAHPQVEERTVAQAASSAWKRGRRRAFSKGFFVAAVLVIAVCWLVGLWNMLHPPLQQVTGRIVETRVDNGTGTVSYLVYTSQGDTVELLVDVNTLVISNLSAYTDQDFRDGKITDALYISAELGSPKDSISHQAGEDIPLYTAQLVEMIAYRKPESVFLKDGTEVEVWQGNPSVLYALPGGAELLWENYYLPDLQSLVPPGDLVDIPQDVEEKILAHYQKQGLLYDPKAELEQAYQEYLQWNDSSPFPIRNITQSIRLSAYSSKLLYFLTTASCYTEGQPDWDIQVSAAFHRSSGEAIAYRDLFTCTPETLIQTIMDAAHITDSAQREEMERTFDPEHLCFSKYAIIVDYPEGTLSQPSTSHTFHFDYDESILDLMYPWAVPLDITTTSP